LSRKNFSPEISVLKHLQKFLILLTIY